MARNDAAPLYRDAPEAQEGKAPGNPRCAALHARGAAQASTASRQMAGDRITTTLSEVGKQFSEAPRTPAEIILQF